MMETCSCIKKCSPGHEYINAIAVDTGYIYLILRFVLLERPRFLHNLCMLLIMPWALWNPSVIRHVPYFIAVLAPQAMSYGIVSIGFYLGMVGKGYMVKISDRNRVRMKANLSSDSYLYNYIFPLWSLYLWLSYWNKNVSQGDRVSFATLYTIS